MNVGRLLIEGATRLKEAGIDNPAKEVELFLCHILKSKRIDLYLNSMNTVTAKQINEFHSFVDRRIKNEPSAYIIGNTEFMTHVFKVNKHVLIPRPETELLVERSLEIINRSVKGYEILDLCTGSGVIAVSIVKRLPFVKMTASDISKNSLSVAVENAALNGVGDKIKFVRSDMFKTLKKTKYHMIISNPPYIAKKDMKNLMKDVKDFEPSQSLDGGREGLKFYKEIIKKAPEHLHPDGYLALEMGFAQSDKVKKIFMQGGRFDILKVHRDYAMIERVLLAKVKNG